MKKLAIIVLSILLIFTFGNNISLVHAVSTVEIAPTDDAYVVANYNDPTDKEGIEHVNTGHLPFLKAWYAWDVTKTPEKVISIVYLKFNLTKISGPIESASLVLHPFAVTLTAPLRPVDIYTGLNSNWNESKIVFVGAPAFSTNDNSTAYVNNSDLNKSISWDLTRQVRNNEGSFLTLALVIRNSYIHNEELVDFYSKEASDPLTRPELVLVTSIQPETAQTNGASSGNTLIDSTYAYVATGLIATAIIGLVVLKRKKHDSINNLKKDSDQTVAS